MDTILRGLVDLRDGKIQKGRIQFSNRLAAIKRRGDPTNGRQTAIVERWLNRFDELEAELNEDITEVVKDHLMYEQLICVKGIGPMMAAKLLSLIDIERCNTVSGLWRYAGLAVINGERERPVKGEKLHYNKRMKALLFNIGEQMLKARSPYAVIYYEWKEYYTENKPDWTQMRRHLAAFRKMNKVFLEHLWRRWRIAEGLPAPEAWIFDIGGHANYIRPEDYGWPKV